MKETILPLRKPRNRTRLLSLIRKNPRLPLGLCTCNNKTCKLCALYIKRCTSFETTNNALGSITSHITCQSKTVICFLKCTCCPVDMRSRMNNQITSCRFWGSTDKFDNHVLYCIRNQKRTVFFSNTNVYETNRQTEFTILWKAPSLIFSINHN